LLRLMYIVSCSVREGESFIIGSCYES
jgi:hypothetical protein